MTITNNVFVCFLQHFFVIHFTSASPFYIMKILADDPSRFTKCCISVTVQQVRALAALAIRKHRLNRYVFQMIKEGFL